MIMGKTSKKGMAKSKPVTRSMCSLSVDDPYCMTSPVDPDLLELCRGCPPSSDGLILTILSITNQHVDQLHFTLLLYLDSQIVEISLEFDVKLHDLQDSLVFMQSEVKSMKKEARSTSFCSRH